MAFRLVNFPVIFAVCSVLLTWLAGHIGVRFRARWIGSNHPPSSDYNVALTATLTLLGLIIGFSFSMAMTRYEQRKGYEEAEANAIGTEYLRVDVLPAADAAKIKNLLTAYTDQRILFYRSGSGSELKRINAETTRMQDQLWRAMEVPAAAHPSPLSALAVSGMNDVLNSQGYTQAAWWNRIPAEAWILLIIIAIYANLLMGFNAHGPRENSLLLVLPVLVGISFLLIADIDSPRGGMVRVRPANLIALSQSLHRR